MADVQANIGVNIETSAALAQLKQLQRQISQFHTQMAKGGAAAQAATANMQQNLVNSINATGKFNAQLTNIKTTTESFTNALEKNKFSMGQYFKYGMASTKTFGRFFRGEFETINKVARERVKDLQTQYIKMGRDANGAMRAIAVRPLALDMENVATRTAIAAQKQQLFNQLLKQGSTNLLNFGKNTQWAGRQLMVGFTIPLSILGMTASRVFMEMEKQAIAFRKVYGDLFTPEKERDQALKDIQNLGEEFTKYGIAIADTIGLAADAAAAGFAGADLQAQTAQATKLAVLGQIETQQALETTIALQNAFKMSNDELAQSINFLNAVENQTVVSLDDITTAIPKVAPVIKSLGGDVEDLAFFLAAMKEGGVNAAEGANALKSGLARIINPTQKATEFMASLGINIKGIVEQNAGDLMGTMMDLGQALDQLDPLNRSRAIEQLFGRFQFARISTLFDNITKQGTQASRVADLATASIEELAALSEGELAVVSESTTAKFQSAFERLKAELAPVGEEFLKLATPFVEFGTKVLEAFNNMGDGTKRIIMGVIAIVGGIGPVALMTFGLMMNGIANLIKMFAVMRNAFTRSKQDTQMLGQQFDYLTQEQIQAASVAASLDQVHNQLKQTFTSEARSVDRLRQAYEKAIAVQRNFRGPITKGGKVVPPKGYASGGIIRGPGTGTSDSIAAMVSNGEAIIPARQTEKYASLIQGIIADRIPGFANGNMSIGAAKKSAGLYKAPSAIAKQTTDMVWSTLQAETEAVIQAAKEAGATQSQIANLLKKQASHLEEDVTKYDVGGQEMSVKEWRAENLQADTGDINNYLNSLKEGSAAMESFSAQDLDMVAKDLGMSMEELEAELDKLKKGIHPQTRKSAQVVQKIASQDPSYQGRAVSARLGVRLQGDYYETLGQRQYDPALDASASKTTQTRIKKVGQLTGAKVIKALEDGVEKGVKQATQQASPSKKARKAGANIGRGAIQGIESATDDAQRAGARVGTAVATGAASGATGGGGRFRDPQTGRFAKAPQAPVGIPASGRAAEGFGKFNRGLMTASFAMTSLSSVAMFAGGETGKFAEIVAKVSGSMFALSGVVELVSMGLGTSIGKKVGKKFEGLATAAGGVTKLLLRFIPIVGGLIAVGSTIAFIVKQKQKVEAFGNAAMMSAEKLNELGNIFGTQVRTVDYTQDLTAQQRAGGPETISQAQQAREYAVENFASEIQAISEMTTDQAQQTINAIIARLQASGFDQEAVQTIVNGIVTEAGQTSLQLNFANITMGPEGLSAIRQNALDSAQAFSTAFTEASGGSFDMLLFNLFGTGDLAKQFESTVGTIAATFDTLRLQLDAGLIGADEFNQEMSTLQQTILGFENSDEIIEALAEKFGIEDVIKGVNGELEQTAILMAVIAGVKLDENTISALSSEDDKTRGRARMKVARQTKAASEAVVSAYEEEAKAAEAAMVAAEIDAASDTMEQRRQDAQDQLDVYNQLISSGVPVAEAQKIIADSTITAALAAAIGTEKFGELLDEYKLMQEAVGQVDNILSSGSGSSTRQSSAIDKLTQGLRDVVDINTQVTEGFNASSRSLDQFLASGSTGFNGLAQSLRGIGASEDFIDLIVGMPPEEFNKYKNRLFNFDKATGSISSFKSEANKLGAALKAIAIGDYLEEQRSFIVNTQHQISAVTKLRSAGLTYAQALKVVENQSIATAIATATTTEHLNEIVRLTQEVAALQAQQDREAERNQISESVRQSNKEYNNQVRVLQKLSRSQGKYTNAQIEAILSDPDLAELFLNPSIDPKALEKALKNAEEKANLDVQLNIAQGKADEELQKFLGEVNDYFDKEESVINLQFDADMAGDNQIVKDAENQIAGLQYLIDDYQAELRGIESQEQTINDKYADRSEALDQVAKANERINRAQQAQMDIADALSRGDIAAAARAQQELRNQQAQAAAETRRETLQKQQAAELAGVRSDSGLSREELEENIKNLQDQIFNIEESLLEPAQERIRLAEIARDLAIEQLQLNGQTRDEFEQIAANAELAYLNMEDMVEAAKKFNALAEFMRTGEQSDEYLELFPTLRAAAAPAPSGGGGGGSAPAPAPAPAPALEPGNEPVSSDNPVRVSTPNSTKKVTIVVDRNSSRQSTPTTSVVKNTSSLKNEVLASVIRADDRKFAALKSKYNKSFGGLIKYAMGGLASRSRSGPPAQMAMGGKVKGYPMGGLIPYKAEGGFFKSLGSDTVPAMLTPGEYVVRRPAVKEFGVKNLEDINRGTYNGGSVYNYSLAVNVRSEADPNRIANTVMRSIKQIEGQRIRGNRI